jgi:hypothetical protein
MKYIILTLLLLSNTVSSNNCPVLKPFTKDNHWKESSEKDWKPMSTKEWEAKWLKSICHEHVCNGDKVFVNGLFGEVVAYKGECKWFVVFDNNSYGYFYTKEITK